MSTTLNDIDLSLQDYVGNYTTGSAQTDVRYRAINRAVEYVKRVLAVPNDETIHTFWYSDDQFFYDLPDTFAEGLQLKYHNPLSNNPNSKWDYFDYPLVLQGVGGSRRNRWSITNINGKKQVVVVGNNGLSGQTLLAMDDITNVAASGDASGLAVSTVRYEGTGAIQFDIVKSTNTATITFSSLNLDLEELFERSGFMKFYAFMTEANISSISLKLQSSVGNFYTMSATVADDGSAFAQDDWQKIGFHTEDAVATLSPNLNAITTVAISFALGASFTTAADFMIDQLFTAFPEQMDLDMLTNIKGTSATGASLTTLSALTDVLLFSEDYDDFGDLIAQQAAIRLYPQLRGDKDMYAALKKEFQDNLRTFGRRFPRKRVQGQFRHSLRR